MISGKYTLLSILLSAAVFGVIVGMVFAIIALLMKSKQFNKHKRILLIGLLFFALGLSLYLAFAFGH